MSEYRVQLPVFSGPLDLLLYLVREREVPAADLPLAAIADQFMEHVKALGVADLDQGGEFLLLASTLMEIKSRELLPDPTPEEVQELEELRTDLVARLLEYRRFREAAQTLAERLAAGEALFARQPPPPEPAAAPAATPLEGAEVWDLVKAFTKILKETGQDRPLSVRYEDVPVAFHMERVVARLSAAGPDGVTFRDLGETGRDRLYWIGLFLALLELVRLSRIRVRSAAGEIRILPRDGTAAEQAVS